jgi:2-polyprenyl-3-methyl-5-hydroxy-6-metoxy-1,4-benzoquinol methylase
MTVLPNTAVRQYHDTTRDDVIPHVPGRDGTLLDAGGGSGATAVRLKQLGKASRVGVIDIVDCSSYSLADFSHVGNIEDESFVKAITEREGPFATILCLDVLEHLVDPWRVVALLHSALEPGGVIVASIPNVRNYGVVLPLVFRNRWSLRDAGILDRTHLRFFVRSTAIDLMTSSGLTLRSVNASPSGGRRIRLFRRLTFGLLNSFTDRQYVICVQRAS